MKKVIKLINFCFVAILFTWFFYSCKKDTTYQGDYNPEVIKEYKNESSSVNSKMDSIEAINFISKQKLREFFELSALASNNNDSVVQDLLINQLKSYFHKNSDVEIDTLLSQFQKNKIHFITITKFGIIPNDSLTADSIKRADYTLNMFNKDKKLVESKKRTSVFVLKQEPIKFKREFKFYFKTLNLVTDSIQKDSIPSGVRQ